MMNYLLTVAVQGYKIWIFAPHGRENIDLYGFLVIRGHKILICSAPGKENSEF